MLIMDLYYTPFYCTRLRRMVPFHNFKCSKHWMFVVPKSTLLSEFGREPINEFFDRQHVIYFARFDELPAHMLCKIVFMELKNSECVEWKYVNYMKNIVQSLGLDHYHYGNFNTNIFNIFSVKQFKIRNYLRYWKWAVYQTRTHLIFHQGNNHIYAA